MLIDSHCHLDDAVFDEDREEVIKRAQDAGVQAIVIPAVAAVNFSSVRALAHQFEGGFYALGIHPMYVHRSDFKDLELLAELVQSALDDPRFIAIGEIGLDFFVKDIAHGEEREKQEHFFIEQLKLARRYDLPVILHIRRSQDIILKYLRRYDALSGIAHAFNGSEQQADQFIELGYLLGMGGAMTFDRAKQIRRHAIKYDLSHYALETDSPDMAPSWLASHSARNTPEQIRRIAEVLAELRGQSIAEITQQTGENVLNIFPRMKGLSIKS
ncbi:MAG: TatD family hydrolase [Alcaligenaceae bacterium]|jgi:TatD DNase family protein|nr:TatD family hydrolase [Alcaligenaceae bacterium]